MNTHLMIDFETLAQTPDSAVLSLGAVLFNSEKIIEEREWAFSLEEQMRAKLSVNPETIIWWLKQGAAAQAVFDKCATHGVSMKTFLPEFHEWLRQKDVRIWGNGASFDVSIVEHLLNRGQVKIPWKFWNIRCYRTLKSLFDIERTVSRLGTKHNALEDAKFQALCVQGFLKDNPARDK